MPLHYHEGEHVTGATNSTVYGETIVSTEEEMKDIIDITASVSTHHDDAYLVGKVDRDEFLRVPVNLLPVFDGSGGTNTFNTTAQRRSFPIDHPLEIGEKLKFGIECAGTQVDLAFAYGFMLR